MVLKHDLGNTLLQVTAPGGSGDTSMPAVELVLGERARKWLGAGAERGGGSPSDPVVWPRILDLIDDSDRPGLLHNIEWLTGKQDGHVLVVVTVTGPDGSTRPLKVLITGRAQAAVLVEADLTQNVEAKQKLDEFRQIVEDAHHAVLVHIDGRMVYANNALARMIGVRSGEDVVNMGDVLTNVHPDDVEIVQERINRRREGRSSPESYELRVLRQGGGYRWANVQVSRVIWEGEAALLVWMVDITDRKAAEEAFRRSDHLFSTVFHSSPDLISLASRQDGRFIDINDRFAAHCGLPASKIIGRTSEELDLFIEPDVSERMTRAAFRESGERSLIASSRRADGEIREIMLTGTPIDYGDSKMMMGVGRDVTELRRREMELRQSKDEAERANRAKSEFLANMSHELRTPLNAVIGFSELIATEIYGPTGDRRYREYARDIQESGEHLLQIINDLLDLSKLEAGRVELNEDRFELRPVFVEVIHLLNQKALENDLKVSMHIEPGSGTILADERLVKQMILNLVSNAVKFTPPGGRIELAAHIQPDGGLEIRVSDSGIGMSDSDLALAMKPFGQVASIYARSQQGTGLGLPLVRSFAELHGGAFAIDSSPNKGTVARIFMPATRVPDAA